MNISQNVTGVVYSAPQSRSLGILYLALQALRLCKFLRSFSWHDMAYLSDETLMSFLRILKALPVEELHIFTYGNLGNTTWHQLQKFGGLKRISILCMEGPPRVLHGWSARLGNSLTWLDLRVSFA